jgi:hypothetical protein
MSMAPLERVRRKISVRDIQTDAVFKTAPVSNLGRFPVAGRLALLTRFSLSLLSNLYALDIQRPLPLVGPSPVIAGLTMKQIRFMDSSFLLK